MVVTVEDVPASAPEIFSECKGQDITVKTNKSLAVNWDDELVKATCLTRDGAIVHPNFMPQ